eukprot:CAMPEP_0113448560 /NCGR_PEP_ID=MMETSP0014_2-20120614/4829_1 /TAXON_ID=2857 /ORGANISM="Nitzschia sp." /LENGTH=998 /DNA_ID=CAMNT_0000339775 /DNA_START=509 /DNA_END=3505 /DNA_ORIENTATION=+ /assembly_acc=CAM_ASM_000159
MTTILTKQYSVSIDDVFAFVPSSSAATHLVRRHQLLQKGQQELQQAGGIQIRTRPGGPTTRLHVSSMDSTNKSTKEDDELYDFGLPDLVLADPAVADEAAASCFSQLDDHINGDQPHGQGIKKTTKTKTVNSIPDLVLLEDQLRLGPDGPVILDGLSSTTWSSKKPSAITGDDTEDESFLESSPSRSSLFLKAQLRDEAGSEFDLSLGTLKTCHRLVASARLNRYWMGPAFGTSAKDIPLDTQFLLVELKEGGPYALLLPLVDSGFRATLQGSTSKDLEVICYSESGDKAVTASSAESMTTLYVAVGDDPFDLIKSGFRQVADETGTFKTLDQKEVPASVDDFGWCTWDAFYSKVTPEGIISGVRALRDAGVPPRNVILDDGWQTVTPYPKDWTAVEKKPAKDKKGIFDTLRSFFIDPIIATVAKVATDYYVAKVERAPYGSIHHRIWTWLSHTVLKQGLWDFFDSQTDFARQLGGFEPNFKFEKATSEVGSNGIGSLKDLVTSLKSELDVKHVYCWHALHGYWRGVSNQLGESIGVDVTQVFPHHTKHTLKIEPQAAFDPPSLFGVGIIQDENHLKTFYKHIHKPLVDAGVDGVKVDVQSGVTAAGTGVGGGPRIARIYTEAMEDSVTRNFPSKNQNGAVNAINCMCHSTENLYRYKVTSIARASEDFFPDRRESHTVHLVNVAYNSLFIGEICLTDWDMFHSKHDSAELHAAARAISGGPVYVSDKPGEHDAELLRKLVLPDGRIVRAKLPGRPTRDCLFADVGQDGITPLKIWNENKGGGGVVGAFHVQGVAWDFNTNKNEVLDATPAPLTARIKPFDVETLRQRKEEGGYAIWRHRSQTLDTVQDGNESIQAPLKSQGEWEIFTVNPIQRSNGVEWAPLGLSNMMNSGGAIEYAGPLEESISKSPSSSSAALDSNNWQQSTTIGLSSHGPGTFVAYSSIAPSKIIIDDGSGVGGISHELPFSHDTESGLLSFNLPSDSCSTERPHQLTIVWDMA